MLLVVCLRTYDHGKNITSLKRLCIPINTLLVHCVQWLLAISEIRKNKISLFMCGGKQISFHVNTAVFESWTLCGI